MQVTTAVSIIQTAIAMLNFCSSVIPCFLGCSCFFGCFFLFLLIRFHTGSKINLVFFRNSLQRHSPVFYTISLSLCQFLALFSQKNCNFRPLFPPCSIWLIYRQVDKCEADKIRHIVTLWRVSGSSAGNRSGLTKKDLLLFLTRGGWKVRLIAGA